MTCGGRHTWVRARGAWQPPPHYVAEQHDIRRVPGSAGCPCEGTREAWAACCTCMAFWRGWAVGWVRHTCWPGCEQARLPGAWRGAVTGCRSARQAARDSCLGNVAGSAGQQSGAPAPRGPGEGVPQHPQAGTCQWPSVQIQGWSAASNPNSKDPQAKGASGEGLALFQSSHLSHSWGQ